MELADLRNKIRNFVLGVFGLIIAFIFIRFFLIFIGAGKGSSFVKFWVDDFTQTLVAPFVGIYPNWALGSLKVETASVIAAVIYLGFAILITKLVISFVVDNFRQFFVNIVDALFKFIEFFLVMRFLFKLTDANTSTGFVKFVYDVSYMFYEPFRGILPTLRFGLKDEYIFETSTLIGLVIVIIFDILTEIVVSKMVDSEPPPLATFNEPVQGGYNPYMVGTTSTAVPTYTQTPQGTNININIPSNPPPPQNVNITSYPNTGQPGSQQPPSWLQGQNNQR